MHGHVQWSIYLISIIILHDYGVLLHVPHIGLGFRFWIYCLNLDCFIM